MEPEHPNVAKVRLPFQRHAWDRYFYIVFAAAACAVVFVGFGPTYYFRLSGADASMPSVVHLHAIVFSAWMLLFLIQTILVETGRMNLHKTIGVLGILLAFGIVIIGYVTLVAGARTGYLGPGVERNLEFSRMFMVVPMRDLVTFIVCFVLAMYFRNTPETHKRLMVLLVVGALLPVALARFPDGFNSIIGLIAIFGPPIYDVVSRRRLHRVYMIGIPLLIISTIIIGPLSESQAWKSFSDWLVG